MSEVSENIKSEKQWLRGLLMLLFLVILEITKIIIIGVTVLQFLFSILAGQYNENLRRLGSSLAQFAKQIVDFLSYTSEDKPFPFAEWPQAEGPAQPELEFASSSNASAADEPGDTQEATQQEATKPDATKAQNDSVASGGDHDLSDASEPTTDPTVAEPEVNDDADKPKG